MDLIHRLYGILFPVDSAMCFEGFIQRKTNDSGFVVPSCRKTICFLFLLHGRSRGWANGLTGVGFVTVTGFGVRRRVSVSLGSTVRPFSMPCAGSA